MELLDGNTAGQAPLRNEPVQARSTARLTALLDAAASAIDELGYERLTTAMVAERAGASIGTVYRYFPDRIAVLQALAARNLERVVGGITAACDDRASTTWQDAVRGSFAAYVAAFRTEPGFASLRGGDVIDLRPATSPTTVNSHLASVLMTALQSRFGTDASPATHTTFEYAVEIMDALIARAFARVGTGDTAFLDYARGLVVSILSEKLA